MKNDIFGQGISFPLQMNNQGGIRQAGQDEKVSQSIRIILGTQHGERVMRPTFGSNLRRLVYAPNNAATASLAKFYVEESLKTWEPRIQLDDVVVENDNPNGRLMIQIYYRLKSTNEAGNLVYPFYLQPA
jgi:phage baseplate assembly protein W